jgi:Rieske Fe-S protein
MKTKKDETANQMGDTGDQIHQIKKDQKDVKDGEKKKEESLDKQNEILVKLKKQHEEQQRLIDEQKKILAELKEHQEEKHIKVSLNYNHYDLWFGYVALCKHLLALFVTGEN